MAQSSLQTSLATSLELKADELEANAPIATGEASAGDYFALLKPRVMSLVVFTGFVGFYLAPASPHPVLAFIAILCIAVGAGAAGAINMWYERDIDAVMTRTRGRPIPAGRIAPGSALGFGVVLAVASVTLMGLAINLPAAALLALSIAFYIFVYTIWLKRRTPQNIVIGGAAGAFPPMIGWAAASGEISLVSLALFAIIFIWTPPHFWSLALYRSQDYARAGIPMLPVVAGANETRRQILFYTAVLVPVTLTPYLLDLSGVIYLGTALVLGTGFFALVARLWIERTEARAKSAFRYSILYLFLLFVALIVDKAAGGMI